MTYQPRPAPPEIPPATRQWIELELQTLADELAYLTGVGVLIQDTPSVNPQAQTTWQVLETWNRSLPVIAPRTMTPDVDNHRIVLTRPGFYMLTWFVNADIAGAPQYDVGLFVNGEPTSSISTTSGTNKDVWGFSGSGGDRLARINTPATLDLRYKASAGNSQFEVERAGMTCAYLGD